MNVLLTGGAGYIGSHTALSLLENSYGVVIVDDFSNSKPKAVERIKEITKADIPLYIGDVSDKDLLNRIFSENKIDAVIHFAGSKAVGESVANPIKYYRNNLGTTLSLLEVMREHGCKRIVFSSSATVYGDPDIVPVTEEMQAGNCASPYGRTKYMIEQILTDLALSDPEMSCIILRYFNPIGAHPSGLLCEDPNGIPNNLMPYILKVAQGKLEKLSVFGNDYPTPDGTGIRDYIHVCDLADGHLSALEFSLLNKGAHIFNLGTGKGSSVFEVLNTFVASTGCNVPYVVTPRRPGDIAEYYASPEKAKILLGWSAKRSLADMCKDSWNAVLQNPDGYTE